MATARLLLPLTRFARRLALLCPRRARGKNWNAARLARGVSHCELWPSALPMPATCGQTCSKANGPCEGQWNGCGSCDKHPQTTEAGAGAAGRSRNDELFVLLLLRAAPAPDFCRPRNLRMYLSFFRLVRLFAGRCFQLLQHLSSV